MQQEASMAAQPSTQGWPKGLTLVVDYLTVDEETALVNSLDELPWLGEIQRRTQQYGYHYSYRKQRVDDTPVPPLPACVRFLLDRFQDDHVPLVAHQLIINEYQPGEQIKPHIDSTTDWGDCVVSLSLLDDWDMIFTHPGHVTSHLPHLSRAQGNDRAALRINVMNTTSSLDP
ncbi:alkB, alkylation repair protein, putative [Acanthamoeba castellanii str. Neff]|uniref:AlkB, alkylation repair protein, putative n=1 Tax=Acanthamoeba castellanii (strain ATCC 30010 / Neff) TaxID=1257118 RepID=L8GWD4_ACACF|nr:alkB, alkylation repair protein, putative [Acanthamoeba castellanii str. Neff]ELR17529.1 alkB, alkylation repair protein, putative [Acanthamoeba castellanii str. Neff]